MALIVRTSLAVNEEDGDLGDPRGVLEIVAAPRGEGTPADGSYGIACADHGARLRLLARTPDPVDTADDTGR